MAIEAEGHSSCEEELPAQTNLGVAKSPFLPLLFAMFSCVVDAYCAPVAGDVVEEKTRHSVLTGAKMNILFEVAFQYVFDHIFPDSFGGTSLVNIDEARFQEHKNPPS